MKTTKSKKQGNASIHERILTIALDAIHIIQERVTEVTFRKIQIDYLFRGEELSCDITAMSKVEGEKKIDELKSKTHR
jgi:hypothetical protein